MLPFPSGIFCESHLMGLVQALLLSLLWFIDRRGVWRFRHAFDSLAHGNGVHVCWSRWSSFCHRPCCSSCSRQLTYHCFHTFHNFGSPWSYCIRRGLTHPHCSSRSSLCHWHASWIFYCLFVLSFIFYYFIDPSSTFGTNQMGFGTVLHVVNFRHLLSPERLFWHSSSQALWQLFIAMRWNE